MGYGNNSAFSLRNDTNIIDFHIFNSHKEFRIMNDVCNNEQ